MVFGERLCKWTQDGAPRFEISDPGETEPLESDLARVLDQLACVTNMTEARIRLPRSLKRNEQNDELRWHASDAIETMQGEGTLAYGQESALSNYRMHYCDEKHFQMLTAQKARAKLDAITLDGQHKMTEAEWYEFTQVWPYFETLTEWNKGGPFKGEWHYRK